MKFLPVMKPQAWAVALGSGLLFIVPLAFYRDFVEQFSCTKVFLTQALVILGLTAWALGLIRAKSVWPARVPLGLPLALLTLAVLLSCCNSPVPAFSLIEAEYFLCGPAWLLLLIAWGGGEARVRLIAKLVAAAGTAIAAIALAQWWGHDPLLWGGYRVEWRTMVPRMRLYSTLGNPNFVAGYLIGAIFPALALVGKAAKLQARALWFLSVAVMFAAVIGVRSRGAWAGLVAGIIVARFIWRPLRTSATLPAKAAAGERPGVSQVRCWVIPAIGVVAASIFGQFAGSLLSRFEGRLYLWRVAWQLFAEHPVLGSGWGTFQIRFLELQARFLAAHHELLRYWTNVRQAHNDLLQLLLEAGLLGLVGFGWVLWTYGRETRQVLAAAPGHARLWLGASAGGITAILVDSLFNFQFSIPPTFLLLFTLLAFPALLKEGESAAEESPTLPKREPRQRPSRFTALRALASVIAVGFAGMLLFQVGRRAAAERDYALGLRLESRRELSQAEQVYRRGQARNSLHGRLHFGLARVLYREGKFSEALSEVLLAERTYADSHLEVLKARLQEGMGAIAPALETYRHALALDPTLTSVRADIERLARFTRPANNPKGSADVLGAPAPTFEH